MKIRYLTIYFFIVVNCFNFVQAQESMPQAEVVKISDDVYSIFLMGYNSLVIIGNDEVAITDTANTFRANLLKGEITRITDKPVKHVILSHEHYDHIGGTEVFSDAEIYCHALCKDVMELDVLNHAPDSRKLITFDTYKELKIGQQVIELHYYGPSDGVANTIIYLPNVKLSYLADVYDGVNMLLPEYLPMDDVNLLGVRKVMHKLVAMDIDYALDAHSSATDPAQITNYANLMDDIYTVTLEWIEKTLKNEDSFAVLKNTDSFSRSVDLPTYKNWENYASLHMYVKRMVASILHGG